MKKLPYQAVLDARHWYDNSRLGYGQIAYLLSDVYKINIGVSTVRDWVNQYTRLTA
jgi:hypothetical protein